MASDRYPARRASARSRDKQSLGAGCGRAVHLTHRGGDARMELPEELTGCSLSSRDDRFILELSLRVLRLGDGDSRPAP